ncbi:MAG: ribosome hibernation-promoting factor, HPF/YfiA family, partial [Geminicoccales bacterium]
MQLTVTGKQIDIGEALQTHVRDALSTSVSKYFSNPVDVQVVFSREAHGFRADVSVHVGRGITARGRAPGTDPYAAFDGALSHMAKRLRRHKRRLRNHHNNRDKAVEITEARQYVLGNA